MTYTDVEGVAKYAFDGVEVEVHPEDVERFDRLNVLPSDEAPQPIRATKKKS